MFYQDLTKKDIENIINLENKSDKRLVCESCEDKEGYKFVTIADEKGEWNSYARFSNLKCTYLKDNNLYISYMIKKFPGFKEKYIKTIEKLTCKES